MFWVTQNIVNPLNFFTSWFINIKIILQVEKTITDLTGFDLVKQTCGVVDFHTIVTKTLDNVKSCAFDELNKSLNNIHKILNGIEDIAKLIQEPMSNIKGCVSGDFEKVKACVDEVNHNNF